MNAAAVRVLAWRCPPCARAVLPDPPHWNEFLWPTPRQSNSEYRTYRRTPAQQRNAHGRYLQVELLVAEGCEGAIRNAHPEWVAALMGWVRHV